MDGADNIVLQQPPAAIRTLRVAMAAAAYAPEISEISGISIVAAPAPGDARVCELGGCSGLTGVVSAFA